jgi:hypothetical protein
MLSSGDSDDSGGESEHIVVKKETEVSASEVPRRRSTRFAKKSEDHIKDKWDVADAKLEFDVPAVGHSLSRRSSLSSLSGLSAQEHDMFCGPGESELKFESDFSNGQKLEVNSEIKTEKWEIEAEQSANLDDEACEFFFTCSSIGVAYSDFGRACRTST